MAKTMSKDSKLVFELSDAHRVKMYEVTMMVDNVYDEKRLQTKLTKYGNLKYTHITWRKSTDGYTVPQKVTHHIMVDLDDDRAFRIMLKQFDHEIDSIITYQLA